MGNSSDRLGAARSPITGAPAILLRTLSVDDLTSRWRDQLKVDPGQNFTSLADVTEWRCPDTGLEFYMPPAAAGEAAMYEELSRYPWYYMEEKWEFNTALRFLKKGDKVLEVGVGFGHFLRIARKYGCEISGVEFNPDAARKARDAEFKIYERPVGEIAQEKGDSFDCVCSFQVLEHVIEPRDFLASILSLVRPGGRLIISVPNSDVMRLWDPDWQNLLDQPPHHMTHWNDGVFRALQTYLPVRVLSFEQEPLQSYHVDAYVDGITRRIAKRFGPGRWVRHWRVMRFASRLLNLGLRKFLPGHSLLVVYERI